MEDLTQRLWDKFREMVENIEYIIDDYSLDEEPFSSLDSLITDTESMRQLRKDLFESGVEGVGLVVTKIEPPPYLIGSN